MRKIKCEHCGLWTHGDRQTCNYCGEVTDERYKQEVSKRNKINPFEFRFVKIYAIDPWWLKSGKSFLYIAQLIFFAVVSVIVYLSSIFVH
ncbi:MAG: hypothetical protein ACFB10_00555 [Salibacteraceae bacterium]